MSVDADKFVTITVHAAEMSATNLFDQSFEGETIREQRDNDFQIDWLL